MEVDNYQQMILICRTLLAKYFADKPLVLRPYYWFDMQLEFDYQQYPQVIHLQYLYMAEVCLYSRRLIKYLQGQYDVHEAL